MRQNYSISKLEQLNLKDDTVLQQDEAPCHFALGVRQFLNLGLLKRWIGRGGPFSWSPPLPGLTPLNFYMGTCENNCVCNQN